MRFTKMHGAGNDYIYINGFGEDIRDPSALAIRMSEPHFGVGSDGLILVLPSDRADFRMRMFNRDGSEGAMCGNGARCVGLFVRRHGLTDKTAFTLETDSGIRTVRLVMADEHVAAVEVDMGIPQHMGVLNEAAHISMGSMHVVHFTEKDPFAMPDFKRWGTERQNQCDANIELVQVLPKGNLKMRVYERGSGETLACGSGACAALVAASARNLCERRSDVVMCGGVLEIDWRVSDGHVIMTGPAEEVFEGDWNQ